MKDSIGGRMNMMTAYFAREGAASSHQIMLGNFPANLAENPIGEAVVFQPFKTSHVIGILLLKVRECVLFHVRNTFLYLP
jgi:hypothetical protein